MKHARLIIKKTKAGGQKGAWRFTVVSANGEPQATSEGYPSKSGADRGFNDMINSIIAILWKKNACKNKS